MQHLDRAIPLRQLSFEGIRCQSNRERNRQPGTDLYGCWCGTCANDSCKCLSVIPGPAADQQIHPALVWRKSRQSGRLPCCFFNAFSFFGYSYAHLVSRFLSIKAANAHSHSLGDLPLHTWPLSLCLEKHFKPTVPKARFGKFYYCLAAVLESHTSVWQRLGRLSNIGLVMLTPDRSLTGCIHCRTSVHSWRYFRSLIFLSPFLSYRS